MTSPIINLSALEPLYLPHQREAVEAFIYLREVRGLDTLSAIVSEFEGENREIAALGIDPEGWYNRTINVLINTGGVRCQRLSLRFQKIFIKISMKK